MEKAITHGVSISVDSNFCGVKEEHQQKHYLYTYHITIQNLSDRTVQLISRKWEIFDSLNGTDIVEGDGVVGSQPILKPNEKHEYTSYCVLFSELGAMKGYYNMIDVNTLDAFKVTVPSFQLQAATVLN